MVVENKMEIPSVSERILEAVAEEEEDPMVDSGEQLFDTVNPDALDKLLHDAPADLTVEFTFLDYRILARGDGTVVVST